MKKYQFHPKHPNDSIWRSPYLTQAYQNCFLPNGQEILTIRAPDEARARKIASDTFWMGLGLFQQTSVTPYPQYQNSIFDSVDHVSVIEIGEDNSDDEGIMNN